MEIRKQALWSGLLIFVLCAMGRAEVNPLSLRINYVPSAHDEDIHACYWPQKNRLHSPGEMNLVVVLGYSDTIDEGFDLVTDQLTRDKVDFQLTQACSYEGQGFCDFKVQRHEAFGPTYYSRVLNLGYNESLLVNVALIPSSYDFSNTANQSTYKNEQLRQTQAAQNLLSWGLKLADVVFYEGHSRDGGGPDFAPPRAAASGKVNYPWYRKNQPGLKFLLDALKQAEKPPMTLGLFSCASQVHFKRKLEATVPNMNTILSTRVVNANLTKEGLLKSMESVLNFECGGVLSRRLTETSFVFNENN